jgi:hypothetical protein
MRRDLTPVFDGNFAEKHYEECVTRSCVEGSVSETRDNIIIKLDISYSLKSNGLLISN